MRRLFVVSLLVAAACSAELPEPDSAGAAAMRTYCGGCHRLHAPGSRTIGMWEMQLDRKRRLFAQKGIPWLRPEEERALRAYLAAHAGTQ